MSRRTLWTTVFLTLTALAVGAELFAANDDDPETATWSQLIGAYVPQTIGVGAAAILAAWITPHIAAQYKRSHPEGGAMVDPIPVPPSREADARNRAARTFWQGLLLDVTVALLVTVGPTLVGSDFTFSPDYWKTLGLLAAKTVISAGIAYLTRKLVPPQFSPDREVPAVPVQTARPVTIAQLPEDDPEASPFWAPKHDGGE